jgi:hypothetical protein
VNNRYIEGFSDTTDLETIRARNLRQYLNNVGSTIWLGFTFTIIASPHEMRSLLAWLSLFITCVFIYDAHKKHMSPYYFRLAYKFSKSKIEKFYMKRLGRECYSMKLAYDESLFGIACYFSWALSFTYAVNPVGFKAIINFLSGSWL